ncbi:MAG TPA: AAA family ATPase, partial [Gemmatimonadaceae bacterium]
MVVLHALGQCLFRTAVTTITPRADMCFALASYLTRQRGTRVPRRWLETFLWPSISAADASHSLSELIHKLGRKGLPIQRDDAACLWIPREAVTIDVDTLGSEAPSVLAARDLAILPGYSPRASPALSDWVDDWRGDIQLRLLDHVITATSHAAADSDWHVSLTLADKALQIDPQSEPALFARAHAAERLARTSRKPTLNYVPSELANSTRPMPLRECGRDGAWMSKGTKVVVPDAPLVGRDQQLAQLLIQVDGVLRGEIHTAYIHGPAGLGKSRLVREVSALMRAKHGAVCVVGCDRHDKHRPLSTFTQAIPRLQELPGAAGCAPTTLACLERVTHTAQGHAALVSHEIGSTQTPASIRAAVIDLIDAVADEQPLLFVVEDVQWIDAASWSLLHTIADTVRGGVFVICTSRLRWQYSAMGDTERVVIVDLPPLEHTASLEHAQNCLARLARTADERFVQRCIDAAAGNPYFVEELIAFWHATGEQFRSPPSLIALTEARIAALRPEALGVIQAAAILGRNSTVELLQKVLEFPTHILLASIEELGEAGLLSSYRVSDGESGAPILCRHDLIIRAATRALAPHARTLLHHAAAETLEAIASTSKSTELLWDCADHWRAAGQVDRSVRATIVCARHLHEMSLFVETLRWCEIALKLVGGGATRNLVLREMAQAQYSSHDWDGFGRTVAEVRT